MAMLVEIRSSEVVRRSGVSARTGKDYTMVEQVGWLFLSTEPYPQRVKITLEKDEAPYSPGRYAISETSFYVGRFDQLQVRLRLDRDKRADLPASRAA